MINKLAIIGSTGSIGKNLLSIIGKDKKKFKIILLSANKNYTTLYKQAIKFNVKNLIITDKKSFKILQNKTKKTNIKVFNSFDKLNTIFKKKIDYVMNSITGIDGLYPSIKIIKYTKKIAIANKESIVTGWNLILKELKKNKTKFIPVDSEHFSIWYGLKNLNKWSVEKIYLTASGGPFNKISIKNFKRVTLEQALKHPNWKMGKKITIDSSTLMNKVFEIIEAKKIFNLNYKCLDIVIHPISYVHAILKFPNGMIKIIAHDTTMKIPISNSLYDLKNNVISTKTINFKKLNDLNFSQVDKKKFPSVNILKSLPNNNSLFETVLVTTNDELVKLFLNRKIKYNEIIINLIKITNRNEFKKLKKIVPTKVSEVIKINEYVQNKINSLI